MLTVKHESKSNWEDDVIVLENSIYAVRMSPLWAECFLDIADNRHLGYNNRGAPDHKSFAFIQNNTGLVMTLNSYKSG